MIKNIALVLMLAVIGLNTGCSKKNQVSETDLATAGADENWSGDSDTGRAGGLQTVNFPYDSFLLDNEAKNVLKANAQVLKDKPSTNIQIEGHCDARGGIQYNLALGEKRANAAKKYLNSQGIANSRITVISFGKEKLLDEGDNEAAHARNRRGNFVITSN